ncbi:hypothetical protein CVT24_004306 [Panaeolus cyanescens]|uniref:Uncharacterized protein n=1 Tax=Panaeolus cyanescens TaxID=181874 RepID=A0A409WW31_9AGAR|nr:hypothetical protein CVT24_004306 [Panaeolus cyanescens]
MPPSEDAFEDDVREGMLVRQGIIRSRAESEVVEGSQVEEEEISNISPKSHQHMFQQMREHVEEPWKHLGSQESWPPFTTYISRETSAYLTTTGMDEAAQYAAGYHVIEATDTDTCAPLPLESSSVGSVTVVPPGESTASTDVCPEDITPKKQLDIGHFHHDEHTQCAQTCQGSSLLSSDQFKTPPKHNPNLLCLRDTKPVLSTNRFDPPPKRNPQLMQQRGTLAVTVPVLAASSSSLKPTNTSDGHAAVSLTEKLKEPEGSTEGPLRQATLDGHEALQLQVDDQVSPSRMTAHEALQEAYRSSKRMVDLDLRLRREQAYLKRLKTRVLSRK